VRIGLKLSNVVDKMRATIDPHPENAAFANEYAQHGGKESLQFAFPFAIPDGKMHMDTPLAEDAARDRPASRIVQELDPGRRHGSMLRMLTGE